mmetsp:Transcript_27591/g.49759  ORF Transcript_27591/g.49759 Transcript_27591/m.49759 type:complete len:112 (-) Transcript_27591:21-356(-)
MYILLYLVTVSSACSPDERLVNDICLPVCFYFNSTSRACILHEQASNGTYEETHDGYNYDTDNEPNSLPWLYIAVAAEVFLAGLFLAIYTCVKRRKYYASRQTREKGVSKV